jgi:SAM-dependent methyltransferase
MTDDLVPSSVLASCDLAAAPGAAFETFVEALTRTLARGGIRIQAASGGRVTAADTSIARVAVFDPGRRMLVEWLPLPGSTGPIPELAIDVEASGSGSRVTLRLRHWAHATGSTADSAAWLAEFIAGPLVHALSPTVLGDWTTDRRARRPAGAESRAIYADPLFHYPNFRVIIDELALGPADYLVEIGCGGGAMLRACLHSGCRAAALDHSADMVATAVKVNHEAAAAGQLHVVAASADRIPFADARFTHATMTGVLGFLADPVAVFREIRRVLQPGGRFVGLGSDPEWAGTPAAPEPIASRLRFYDDEGLVAIARTAGFEQVRVLKRDLEPHARDVGVPVEFLPLFAGMSRFLVATK